ncbi:MAG TPA: glutathione-regulated potassium-efflux system protein KefC [Burkholderiaceae bacterium]|nr:glutathione-regulated potassium-efflux system protein KefC [Burkholderiaceae bacterium]
MAEGSLLTDTLIYLGAAVVCVPVAKRLGLGSVLGYLIAGVAIGPWGLRLVGDPQSTLHFAEFGVVLMLFLIGLEIDLNRLTALRRAVFGGGSMQMLVCGALLAAAFVSFRLPWIGAIVAALAVAMSSTAIATQTLNEKNQLGTALGRTAFGVLLFQDIVAIPLIAVVPLLGSGERQPGSSAWIATATALAAIAGVIALGRFVMRPLIRVIAAVDVREIFTAFALLLVIGVALVMTFAGLSMGLGAFLVGALFASSEYRHALEGDIEPFKGLLLGLFFIAIGMSIDVGLIGAQPGTLALLVATILAVKGVALALLARRLGVPARERWLFAALLAQGGEFAFVVLGAARDAQVLPGTWGALLNAAVALSMATTPLLVIGAERWATRRAAQREDDVIEDAQAPVIIAGFGRYGQIIGRMLRVHGVSATVLDHDPDNIELVARFGYKVFYGDATRLDLLQAAGAANARLLVVAIDQIEDSLKLVDLARTHFPNLQMVVRARNVRHWLELAARGIDTAERETFESALRTGRQALERLGMAPYEARELADTFRRNNQATLQAMRPHFQDQEKLVALARSGLNELEENLRRDREARGQSVKQDWE